MNPGKTVLSRRRLLSLFFSAGYGLLILFLLLLGLQNVVTAETNAGNRIDVNYGHDWVEVETSPNVAVTVTVAGKATVSGTAGGDGWFRTYEWNWDTEQPDIAPGDVITALADGLTAVVDPVGTITGKLDVDADTISGTIAAPWLGPGALTVRCEVWEEFGPMIEITGVAAAGGSYFCDFSTKGWDVQPGQQVAVRYLEPDGDTVINVIESPWMRVNYGHDWAGGDYPAGHTFWITVTDSADVVKATAEIDSESGSGWNGEGFNTDWANWSPQQPDIVPGDWVYFASDDGYTNAIQVGTVDGTVDAGNDSVSGSISASWFTETLDVECHPWGAPGPAPSKNSTAEPDGSTPYSCQWDSSTEWDILPGQDVAVMYIEPDDLDRVINVFQEPAPYLRIEKWADGQPGEGGNYIFNLRYYNEGGLDAPNVVISDTLLGGMTYISDTSGFPHTGSGSGPIVWDLGTVPPNNGIEFRMFVGVTAAAGETITNTAEIATSNPYDQGDPNEKLAEWSGQVQPNDTHLSAGKYAWTGDPVAGGEFVWAVNACNNGGTASSEVIVTDTLPISATLLSWWGQQPGWTEVSRDSSALVLSLPAIQSGWCNEALLLFQVDAAASVGMPISNTVTITASNDLEGDDNESTHWINVGEPHTNLKIDKWWGYGQLVPGGEIRFQMAAENNGNGPVDNILITDTLPVSTTLVGIEAYDRDWNSLGEVTPTLQSGNMVVWEAGTIPNGDRLQYEVQLVIDADAVVGTVLTNSVEISPQPNEDDYDDNLDTVVEQVYGHGPNLRVHKDGQWDDWGENTRRASYWLNVENVGDALVMPVVVTDTYDSQMYLDGGVNVNYWRSWDWSELGGYFTVTLEALYGGESVGINFATLTDTEPLPFGLIFTNTAEVTLDPADINPADNTTEAILTTGPDLYVTKELQEGIVEPGELITFSLTYGNDRWGHEWWWGMQGDAWLTDTLPAGLEFVSASQRSCGWCDLPADNVDGQSYAWNVGAMGPGHRDVIHLVVRISDAVKGGDILTNQVNIESTQPSADIEPYYDNNSDSYELDFPLHYIYLPVIVRNGG